MSAARVRQSARSLSGLPRTSLGFTLLELMIVLFIVVLGFAAIGISISSGNETTQLKAAARDIVSALRYVRGQALMTHQETVLTFDLKENTYTVTGRDKVYDIANTIDVTIVTGQNELSGDGLGNIRFFADGSSTGGRMTLELKELVWQIDINWLTGQIELHDPQADE